MTNHCDGCDGKVKAAELGEVRVSLERTYRLCPTCYQTWLISPTFRGRLSGALGTPPNPHATTEQE